MTQYAFSGFYASRIIKWIRDLLQDKLTDLLLFISRIIDVMLSSISVVEIYNFNFFFLVDYKGKPLMISHISGQLSE